MNLFGNCGTYCAACDSIFDDDWMNHILDLHLERFLKKERWSFWDVETTSNRILQAALGPDPS